MRQTMTLSARPTTSLRIQVHMYYAPRHVAASVRPSTAGKCHPECLRSEDERRKKGTRNIAHAGFGSTCVCRGTPSWARNAAAHRQGVGRRRRCCVLAAPTCTVHPGPVPECPSHSSVVRPPVRSPSISLQHPPHLSSASTRIPFAHGKTIIRREQTHHDDAQRLTMVRHGYSDPRPRSRNTRKTPRSTQMQIIS
jgi:hypothetical protein